MKSWILTIMLLLVCHLSAADLYKCPQPPLIDGVEESAWEAAERFPLVDVKTGQPLVMATVARLMYDDQHLYAFVHCREVNLVEARDQERFGRHDAPVWGNGCVEFFVDVRNDGRAFYQFVVDVHGSAADLRHHDPDGPAAAIDWNGFWRRAVGTDADGWTVEVAIPWRTLNVAPGTARRLGLNISRVRRISPFERGTLAAGAPSISDVTRFPVFANIQIEAPDVSAEIQPAAVFLGNNRMRLRVRNQTDAAIAGQIELVGTAADAGEVLRQAVPLELAAGETRDVTVDYRIDRPGRVQVAASLVRGETVRFLDLADYVFRQPIELHDRHPLVYAGEDHPAFVRIFTDGSGWALDVAVRDHQGHVRAEARDALAAPSAFLLLPTARLAPGDYTVRLRLNQTDTLGECEVPLTVIRRP